MSDDRMGRFSAEPESVLELRRKSGVLVSLCVVVILAFLAIFSTGAAIASKGVDRPFMWFLAADFDFPLLIAIWWFRKRWRARSVARVILRIDETGVRSVDHLSETLEWEVVKNVEGVVYRS